MAAAAAMAERTGADVFDEFDDDLNMAVVMQNRKRDTLLRMTAFLIATLAFSFQTNLNSSTHQLALIVTLVMAYFLSDVIMSLLTRLLSRDGFSRPRLAELVMFAIDNPLSFISYIVMNIFRDNLIGSGGTVSLEDIAPLTVLLVLFYIEKLFQDARLQQTDELVQRISVHFAAPAPVAPIAVH